jgi:hypothetical protein
MLISWLENIKRQEEGKSLQKALALTEYRFRFFTFKAKGL